MMLLFRLVRLSPWTRVLPVSRRSRPLRCKLKRKPRPRLRSLNKLAALVLLEVLNNRLTPKCLLKHRHRLRRRRRLRSKPKPRRRHRLKHKHKRRLLKAVPLSKRR